ncbi:MAG TPA: DUF547 domain-containing protein [Myxococcota bacterium]|nr:DUF547 domain-containing protein [Myxococcota bacterium]
MVFAVAWATDPATACWDELVRAHVHDGAVDYAALRGAARPALDGCVGRFAEVRSMAGWTEPQRLAWWINAYNAYTVLLVVEHPGIASIKDIGWPLSTPWKQAFIHLEGLAGRVLTLDDVEHDVIRKAFAEPRVHMALVCASRSCPPLRAEAYAPDRLDAQLGDQARRFLADPSRNRVDAAGLHLSKIFAWYEADFAGAGGVREFLATWGPPPMQAAAGSAPIDHLPYDWSLNGR